MIRTMLIPTPAGGGSLLLAGEIYQYGTWIMMSFCAIFVMIPKEADHWAQDLGWRKIAALATLWVVSLAMLTAQDFNPFLYFQF